MNLYIHDPYSFSLEVSFLVDITSLRCISELQVFTLEEPFFQVHSDSVVLRINPKFISKVVSSFHLNQTIELPVFFPQPEFVAERALYSLDVKRALMYHIDRTKPFRKTQQLFVSFSNPHKGQHLSKSSIACCLVKCIQTCFAEAKRPLPAPPRPHSTRKKGVSMAFIGNIPIADICKASTWSTLPNLIYNHNCVDGLACHQAKADQAVLRTLLCIILKLIIA